MVSENLTTTEKSRLRETALKLARDLNPNTTNTNMSYAMSVSIPPSLDKVISDADKIYNWLLKL